MRWSQSLMAASQLVRATAQLVRLLYNSSWTTWQRIFQEKMKMAIPFMASKAGPFGLLGMAGAQAITF